MKKIIAILLAALMALSFTACDFLTIVDSSGNSSDNSGNSQTKDNEGDKTDNSLFEIEDKNIYVFAEDLTTRLTGEEAEEMIAKIPAEIRKGIGTLAQGLCSLSPDTSDEGYNFGFTLKVSGKEEFDTLTNYYKSLGGTVKDEGNVGDTYYLEMTGFSWGEIYDCKYQTGSDKSTIKVSFSINGNSGNGGMQGDNSNVGKDLANVNKDNYEDICKEVFGMEALGENGWELTNVKSPNGVNNLIITFEIPEGSDGKTLAKKYFDASVTICPGGVYSQEVDWDTMQVLKGDPTTDFEAYYSSEAMVIGNYYSVMWIYDYNNKSVQVAYSLDGTKLELTLTLMS